MAVETSSVAGIVAGRNPLDYSSSAPYTIFLFQAVFIILLCQIVHYPLGKLRQPKVIAEVVTGILLGPSVLGKAPNFTDTCFPAASIPGLTLFANIGIILFLFIVGLEVDINFIKKHARVAVSVGLVNMAIPFALGCGISKGMYDEYRSQDTDLSPIKYTTFMVFIAVAMCITAFPVLARILTELNLIGDRVGTIVLAAGIMNDLTGWLLLALSVTLANASRPVNVVYILLLTAGWFVFLCFPVRLTMKYCLRRFTDDLVTGEPSQSSMLIILLIVFISAFFTDIIGVHPIFGAFMVGVIVPRDNGYVVKITEKLEDLVHIILIPLYFALAGLNVNLGLLNKGIDWAYTIGIILLAMVGKIFGGFIAAKLNKLFWRESLAVGVLMSCKGIVEIVVLSVGLNSGIISQKVYSMFVVMALVTTFLTTPLALWVYPLQYRDRVANFLSGKINWNGEPKNKEEIISQLNETSVSLNDISIENLGEYRVSKVILLLKKIDTVSFLMSFIKIFSRSTHTDIKAIHMREFSSRTSHLLEVSSNIENSTQSDSELDYSNSSSILSIIKAFSEILGINCVVQSILAPARNYVLAINDQISERSDFLISSMKSSQLLGSLATENEDSEINLFSRLFRSCKSHFGLLLINDGEKRSNRLSTVHEIAETKTLVGDESSIANISSDLSSINVILFHDNILSANDFFTLHLASSLSKDVTSVNLFIRGNSADSEGFLSKINSLFESSNPAIRLSTRYVKGSLTESIVSSSFSIKNQLFLIAKDTPNDDSLFTDETIQLIKASVDSCFNILVVRASTDD